jgi:FtsP/CotA-like multicopper oxidase with cupredoxin domain
VRTFHPLSLSRRNFLAASGAAATASLLRPRHAQTGGTTDAHLIAKPGHAHLVGASYPKTAVWAYNANVPGPEIRIRQGGHLRVTVENQLPEETTVHWHGVRVPNSMDGVPHLTQSPIASGESFVYEFDVPDAGTYWYHPHQRSFEQVGRGLYGPLIVEEEDPIQVDRDVIWSSTIGAYCRTLRSATISATSWMKATTAGSATPSRSTAASYRPSRSVPARGCGSV